MENCLALKKSGCKNCYKCLRYCPVKSIRFSGNRAHIMNNECILCGRCYAVCPQNAREISDGTERTKVMIQSGVPVYVSLEPSFAAYYSGVGFTAMRQALLALGFTDAEDAAIGAAMVKSEYNRLLTEEKRDIVISSSCHSVNLLIQKYFPKQLKYLADVVSPMQAHCRDIKKRHPEAKTVYICPCVAKKDEAEHYEGIVDVVLTFEELSAWFAREGVVPERKMDSGKRSLAHLFPLAGGMIKSMGETAKGYTYLAVDGTDNCIAAIKDIENGNIHRCFIEMSACRGGCVGGPVMEKYYPNPITNYLSLAQAAGTEELSIVCSDKMELRKHFTVIDIQTDKPSEADMRAVLKQLGKNCPEDELNCGSCGYDTCREKAAAILQGKAEGDMCLPYLKDKAEAFLDTVVNYTPNALIVLNDQLEVQKINDAARKIMNIRAASDVLGEPVVRILDPSVFMQVLNTKRSIRDQRVYLAEYGRFVEQSVVYDENTNLLICSMRDVTYEENARRRKDSINRNTIEVADKVVEKQMRIVQEIASLLGETAAETKIALTKLKESIKDE
ncbi:MAG: histidine kinase [Ruminococcaceae bacterium]|nr:histidine kinase [Oscillospiraceae bacterium]